MLGLLTVALPPLTPIFICQERCPELYVSLPQPGPHCPGLPFTMVINTLTKSKLQRERLYVAYNADSSQDLETTEGMNAGHTSLSWLLHGPGPSP